MRSAGQPPAGRPPRASANVRPVSEIRQSICLILQASRPSASGRRGRCWQVSRRRCGRRASRATPGGLTVSASPVTSSVGAAMQPRIDGGRLGERLAGPGVAFRILAHQRLADEGDGDRLRRAGRGRQRVVDDLVGDRRHAFAAGELGAAARGRSRVASAGSASAPRRTSERTRAGRSAAIIWQTMVPSEWPTKWACADRRGPGRRRPRLRRSRPDGRLAAASGERPLPGRSMRTTR